MEFFDPLSHLTQPAVENLPKLEQPAAVHTRYTVKSEGDASVSASNATVHANIWFKSPPLTTQTLRMIRAIKLFAESHDQGFISNVGQGNWTWFELVILDNKDVTSPKKDGNGKELVVISHPNKAASKDYEWMQVRLCARFAYWKIFARNGHLVIDISDDNNPFPITPISINTNDTIPSHRNVEEWYAEAKTDSKTALELSLFIRALKAFQSLPPNDQLSYYRIAAIHGHPHNVSWNMGEAPIPLDAGDINTLKLENKGGNYCQHNNYLFPTWHRTYMMLFEEWVSAASLWRLPYWDWALKPSLPNLARDKKISIISSWDSKDLPQYEEVDNPMYRFQMPGHKPMGDAIYKNYRIDNKDEDIPWDMCIGTSRHGITLRDEERKWIEGVSINEKVDLSLAGVHEDLNNLTLKDAVFRLLTRDYTTKYVNFASTKHVAENLENAPGDTAKGYLSLEQIHNSVHDFIGGNTNRAGRGHMSSVAVAAFDPVFWLHHCNTDRLLHLWQCSNPGNWFHQKLGQVASDSPLENLVPFRASTEPDNFFNSNNVRHVDALNYTYNYMDQITDKFGDIIPGKCHTYINKLYGPDEEAFKNPEESTDPLINIVYNRYCLNGKSYSLLFFLGDVDPEAPYNQQKNLVGSIFTFSSALKEDAITCKNCYEQKRVNVLSRAQVPLTRAVPIQHRENSAAALEYFQEHLKWTAISEAGEVIAWEKLTDLKITLFIGVNQLHGNKLPGPLSYHIRWVSSRQDYKCYELEPGSSGDL
ncbi:tyrosinase central domain containing protein [Grosmannia clavigera kw1407]|uniref:tyrosinase n=1 Tax=Grosmannia clavigera (strain kw1407 / UAMH 11150) TaxID=655863 RepID=F0XST1_GROCL|nr:tyrosinase central domain containing protein [Grosmannia clavigera kw1407]EFW99188.1 tyrosinase central domain containing protein [Grosmannia clavigera kw1407]